MGFKTILNKVQSVVVFNVVYLLYKCTVMLDDEHNAMVYA